jgi:hypothetical protein
MTNKLHLVPNPVSLIRHWESTGDPKIPLACVWTASKHSQSASTAFSTDETERMPPVRHSWQRHVLTMVFGPGPMVMEPDDDVKAMSSGNSRGGKSR